MRKVLWPFLMGVVLVLSGCGSNDFDVAGTDVNTSVPETGAARLTVVKPDNGVYTITDPGLDYEVVLRATEGDKPLTGKTVEVATPDFPGSFVSKAVETSDSGEAKFIFHPSESLAPDVTFSILFRLKDYNATVSVMFRVGNDVNASVVDNINYSIVFKPSDNAFNLALGMQKTARVLLIDYDKNETIDSQRVESIQVRTQDPTVLKIASASGGVPSEIVTFNRQNDILLLLVADDQNSGLAPLVVTITYINLNGVRKTIEQTFSIAVLSGPPTAFSIHSDGIAYNFDTKQFEHKYIIQAVDRFGNPIAREGIINVSAMAGFAKDADGREMIYGRWAKEDEGISAELSSVDTKGHLVLSGINPFSQETIDQDRAFVAVFGTVQTYEANGLWNIESILSDNTLALSNQYMGDTYSGLGMAVGYNYRDQICSSDYRESVVFVDSTDGKYTLDRNGQAFVTMKFDPYMIGKRTALIVNTNGYNPITEKLTRSGEVYFDTQHFVKYLIGKTIKIPKGSTNYPATIWGMIDTGTEDRYWVRNSRFACTIELNNAVITAGPIYNDPMDCRRTGGVPSITYELNATDSDADGSITFKECQVVSLDRF